MSSIPQNDRPIEAVDIEKRPTETIQAYPEDIKFDTDDTSTHKQDGVRRVEAITKTWSMKTMWLMFALLYLVSFVDMMVVSIQSNLTAYVTSAFSQHALLSTVTVISSILGGSIIFSIAKMVDIWGRVEGFLVMLTFSAIGLIMKAACKNVETYAAAHTFYWVGHLGLQFVISIVLADMTSLRNRMVMFTINGTPTIATTFAGPAVAELFYEKSTYNWAFGSFCIIIVAVSMPAVVVLLLQQRKAAKLGALPEKVHRTAFESLKYYLFEFDVPGLILISVGFSLILLPFSLATSAPKGWATGYIIACMVLGIFLLAAFVLWEKFAPVQVFPFRYLKDRTILGSCLLYGFMFLSVFCWDTYYYSYLQVVHDLSISHAGYVLNAFSLTSSFISPFIGFLIHFTGDFKYTSLVGIPFVILGTVLLIHLRTPNTHVGLLVMCQVMNGIGTGILAVCAQLAIMASVTHQQLAIALALWGMFGSLGASVGVSIAGALWTNLLPSELYEHLPEDSKNLTASIYSSFVIQQEYPIGSPIRDSIISAYGDVQRKMVIAGSAFIPIMLISLVLWKKINVKTMEEQKGKQTNGTVF